MKYTYTAVDAKGKKHRGSLTAHSETDALAALRVQSLVPVQLRAVSSIAAARAGGKKLHEIEIMEGDIHKAKLPHKRLVVMFNQLAIMMRAGVNLSLALDVMLQSEKNRKLKKILQEMLDDLMAGVTLSSSMAKFRCFDNVTVNIVRAGEADGRLERSFRQIADLQEKSRNLGAKVKSAAVYPCILLVLVIGVVALMNVMILPAFIDMFAQLGDELPGITQFVMHMSDFTTKYWWIIMLAVAAAVFAYRFARQKSPAFCVAIDRAKLKIPVGGKVILHAQVARFSRVLSTLLDAGQDFLTSLLTARSTLTNEYIKAGLAAVADEVRVGVPVSTAMQKHSFFAPVFISMLRAGEESGSISETLEKMAEMYEQESEESTKRLTTLMEPAMTVVIAIIVGTVVLAIAIPMFSMFNLVGSV